MRKKYPRIITKYCSLTSPQTFSPCLFWYKFNIQIKEILLKKPNLSNLLTKVTDLNQFLSTKMLSEVNKITQFYIKLSN